MRGGGGGGNDGGCADLSICLFQSFFFFKDKNKKFSIQSAFQKKSHCPDNTLNNPTAGPLLSLQGPLHQAVGDTGVLFYTVCKDTPNCSEASSAASFLILHKAP